HEGRPSRWRLRALARSGGRSRGLESPDARARYRAQEREGASVSLAPRDHEGEEEGNTRATFERARARRHRADLDGPLDGAAAGARRRQDPEGRGREADRRTAGDRVAR